MSFFRTDRANFTISILFLSIVHNQLYDAAWIASMGCNPNRHSGRVGTY
jgi:hypothetical protein